MSIPAFIPVTLAPVSIKYCLLYAEDAAPVNKRKDDSVYLKVGGFWLKLTIVDCLLSGFKIV